MNALLERAASLKEAEMRTAQDDLAEWRRRYVEILSRQDAPKKDDPQTLLDIAAELKLTPAQVEEDAKLVARYTRLSNEAKLLDERHRALVVARSTFFEFRKKCDRDVADMRCELLKLENHASSAHVAGTELTILTQKHPDLLGSLATTPAKPSP